MTDTQRTTRDDLMQMLDTLIEQARQHGYDSGYEDALSLLPIAQAGTTKQLSE